MVITAIEIQAKNKDRVNVHVDGVYAFSLDVFQVGELGIKVGREYSESDLEDLKKESEFGKAYGRALELIARRPRSLREMHDYAYKKKWDEQLTNRIIGRLEGKGYVDDVAFARFWVRARANGKPMSRRALQAELRAKGVTADIVERALGGEDNEYDELAALKELIRKRRGRYDDEQKFIAFLARKGFSYDVIKRGLTGDED